MPYLWMGYVFVLFFEIYINGFMDPIGCSVWPWEYLCYSLHWITNYYFYRFIVRLRGRRKILFPLLTVCSSSFGMNFSSISFALSADCWLIFARNFPKFMRIYCTLDSASIIFWEVKPCCSPTKHFNAVTSIYLRMLRIRSRK